MKRLALLGMAFALIFLLTVPAAANESLSVGENISISKAYSDLLSKEEFANLYEKNEKYIVLISINEGEEGGGLGSGIIWTKDGYILTNAHVARDGVKLKVYFSEDDFLNNSFLEAKIVGRDEVADVALIKVDSPKELEPARMGDSDKIKPGQFVAAVGNPNGFIKALTVGVVSGLHRYGVSDIQEWIQTDAALNPGNSGGALFNIRGEVIGINVAIKSDSNSIGFAIPINDALRVAEMLKKFGKAKYGFLGVQVHNLASLNEALAKKYNLPWPPARDKGMVVVGVSPGSPAEKSGLLPGDIFLSYDGKEIPAVAAYFIRMVARSEPGAPVRVKVLRNGAETELVVTPGERPPESELNKPPEDDSPKLAPAKPKDFDGEYNYGDILEKLPSAVSRAVVASQGLVAAAVPQWDGSLAASYANGVIVGKKHVLSVMSILPPTPAAVEKSVFIFNRIKMKLIAIESESGLALFEAEEEFPDQRIAKFSDKLKLGATYMAVLLQDISVGFSLPAELRLIFAGRILYFDRPLSERFSGVPVVDGNGAFVGMLTKSNNPDASMAVSPLIIKMFVDSVLAAPEEKKDN